MIIFFIVLIALAITGIHYVIDKSIFNRLNKSNLKYWIFSIVIVVVLSIVFNICFYFDSTIVSVYVYMVLFIVIVTIFALIRLVSKIKNGIVRNVLTVLLFICCVFTYLITIYLISISYGEIIPRNYMFEVSGGRVGDNHVYVYKNGTVRIIKSTRSLSILNIEKVQYKDKLKGNYDLKKIKKNLKEAAKKYNSQETKDTIQEMRDTEKLKLGNNYMEFGDNIYLSDMSALYVRFKGDKETRIILGMYIDEFNLGDFTNEIRKFSSYSF